MCTSLVGEVGRRIAKLPRLPNDPPSPATCRLLLRREASPTRAFAHHASLGNQRTERRRSPPNAESTLRTSKSSFVGVLRAPTMTVANADPGLRHFSARSNRKVRIRALGPQSRMALCWWRACALTTAGREGCACDPPAANRLAHECPSSLSNLRKFGSWPLAWKSMGWPPNSWSVRVHNDGPCPTSRRPSRKAPAARPNPSYGHGHRR